MLAWGTNINGVAEDCGDLACSLHATRFAHRSDDREG
jgi:hypothetical protein